MKLNRHKFYAIKTDVDGIRFDSKKEARYYQDLLLRKKCGNVLFWLRQVPFDLPGGVKYRVDFVEFMANGTIAFVDVKGHRTKEYIMKKKMVESLYPVKIEEV